MRIEQLHYLVELNKIGSMTLVAERNYVSHQCVSKAVRQLEKEYGVHLIKRTAKGVSLTETGRAFAEKAVAVLDRVKDLDEFKCLESERENTASKRSLSISTSPNADISVLRYVTAEFCRNNPCIKVKIADQPPSDIIRDVENGKSDFGLVVNINNRLGDHEDITVSAERGLVFEKLFDDKLFVVAGKKHPITAKKSISMKQVMQEPLALFEGAFYINKLLRAYGTPNIYHMSNSIEILTIMIAEGLALTVTKKVLPTTTFINKEDFVRIPIRENPKISVGFLYSMKYPLSSVAQEFIDMLKSHY